MAFISNLIGALTCKNASLSNTNEHMSKWNWKRKKKTETNATKVLKRWCYMGFTSFPLLFLIAFICTYVRYFIFKGLKTNVVISNSNSIRDRHMHRRKCASKNQTNKQNVSLIKSLVRKEFCTWNSCWVFIPFCFLFFLYKRGSLLQQTYTFSCSFSSDKCSCPYALLSQQPQIAITWNSFVIFMLMMLCPWK